MSGKTFLTTILLLAGGYDIYSYFTCEPNDLWKYWYLAAALICVAGIVVVYKTDDKYLR